MYIKIVVYLLKIMNINIEKVWSHIYKVYCFKKTYSNSRNFVMQASLDDSLC